MPKCALLTVIFFNVAFCSSNCSRPLTRSMDVSRPPYLLDPSHASETLYCAPAKPASQLRTDPRKQGSLRFSVTIGLTISTSPQSQRRLFSAPNGSDKKSREIPNANSKCRLGRYYWLSFNKLPAASYDGDKRSWLVGSRLGRLTSAGWALRGSGRR
jgi:hypothetical protein